MEGCAWGYSVGLPFGTSWLYFSSGIPGRYQTGNLTLICLDGPYVNFGGIVSLGIS